MIVGLSGMSGATAFFWVIKKAGIFEKYGLNAILLFDRKVEEKIASGQFPFGFVGAASLVAARLRGDQITLIAGGANTMPYALITAKEIKNPEQLRNKTIIVDRKDGSGYFAICYILQKLGLDPDKDVTIKSVGNQPSRFTALKGGRIDGTVLTPPLTISAQKLGFNLLLGMEKTGLEYQHTGLAAKPSFLKEQPETAKNFLKAYLEGIWYLKTHKRESLEVMSAFIKTDDQEALEETYREFALKIIPQKPYPTLKGIQLVLNQVSAKNPKAQTAKPEDFVDTSLLEEIDQSGFIDQLYN